MKSTVVNISREQDNLNGILSESKKTCAYAGLDAKQELRIRLLAEELIGMLKEMSSEFEGEFWIEQNGTKFELITQIYTYDVMDKKTKRGYIEVSSSKKNAAAKGIMGRIRHVAENFLYSEDAAYNANYISYQLESDALSGNIWSLNNYKDSQETASEPWDEIEKSIVANLADDVTVSVKGKSVEIIITKSF